jgi:hypothetical protein
VRQFPLSVNSGKPIAAINHRIGFQREMREIISYGFEWAFRYQLFAVFAGRPFKDTDNSLPQEQIYALFA